ncbi:spore germination protein [Evansella cellulosilytica]|uniref:GerA spore germination protein n=1 Tax=Evansella cellulosilytica (strain ATCC 21833 / DSM 2522 / FERM P-1141 / JCM 9156 / N-4) TaxID=649639 RepID=E6TYZ6_EVAC2|nr:spore germination protein [Evansella cellulosilytica]ADU32439.1 GerA spore germination protein [Evansella cellulosilytica DSM 2522]
MTKISNILNVRINWFQSKFQKSEDVVYYTFSLPNEKHGAFIYIQGLVDLNLLQNNLIDPLLDDKNFKTNTGFLQPFEDVSSKLPIAGYSTTLDLTEANLELMDGNILLLFDEEDVINVFSLSNFKTRSITESQNENVVRGPRESFVEDIDTNITMIRRKIKSEKLSFVHYRFGRLTKTKTSVLYIDGVCEQKLIDEIDERISRIDIDGIFDTSYIEAYLEDQPYSLFPQFEFTEKPDVAAAALLDGRAAVLVDGAPNCIIAPVTFFMLMQTSEDFYNRPFISTWTRWIRFMSFIIALVLPSFYIAVTTFHSEMIPNNLLLSIASAREVVPFPGLLEALILELTFEVLREASIRIPKILGQTVSILGALVIGTAAVQAGIVSAPLVIIVSLTGITSYVIPQHNLIVPIRLLRFPLLLMAGFFGLYGIMISLILIMIHLSSLRSFGTPYLTPVAPYHLSDWKDMFIRVPLWMMNKRPHLATSHNSTRSRRIIRPQLPKEEERD